jgi:cytochrome c5
MRTLAIVFVSLLLLAPALRASSVKLIDAPPPPPIPDAALEEDGTPKSTPIKESTSRGQLLYENHCMGCHESVAQIRTRPQVKSQAALREAVARWAANTKLAWSREEIEEVTRYLGARYYGFEKQSGLK